MLFFLLSVFDAYIICFSAAELSYAYQAISGVSTGCSNKNINIPNSKTAISPNCVNIFSTKFCSLV